MVDGTRAQQPERAGLGESIEDVLYANIMDTDDNYYYNTRRPRFL